MKITVPIFSSLFKKLEDLSGYNYKTGNDNSKSAVAFRVVIDHVRAVAFSIADGQLPSNTGAGYVIRRILRRAVRYGYQFLNFKEPFIHLLVDDFVSSFDGYYKELDSQKEFIVKIIFEEESSFFKTLSSGIKRIDEIVKKCQKHKTTLISGEQCFELYDSFYY